LTMKKMMTNIVQAIDLPFSLYHPPRIHRGLSFLILLMTTMFTVGCGDDIGHGSIEAVEVYVWRESTASANSCRIPVPVPVWVYDILPTLPASNGAVTLSTKDPRSDEDIYHYKWYCKPPTILSQVSGEGGLLAGYTFTIHSITKDRNGTKITISAEW